MPTPTLYVYSTAAPTDLSVNAAVALLQSIAESRQWCHEAPTIINQVGDGGHSELGFNYRLPEPYREPADWFTDVEALVLGASRLREQLGCDFVVGVADARGRNAEDVLDLDGTEPDLVYLRSFLGNEPPSTSRESDA